MSESDTLAPRASNRVLQPAGWRQPKGYANGIKARGEMIFVGGMIGWDENERFPADFVGQTRQLLKNIVAVLAEGGAAPQHIVRMTWYVRDMDEYLKARPALREIYRSDGRPLSGDGPGRRHPPGRAGRASGDRDHRGRARLARHCAYTCK